MTILYKTAKNRKSAIARRKIRRKISEAVQSEDPLSNLRHMHHVHKSESSTKKTNTKNKTATALPALFDAPEYSTTIAEPSTAGESPGPGVSATDEAGSDFVQLLDVQYIQRAMPLPTPEEYRDAQKSLFDHVSIATAIHNQCAKQKLSVQVHVDFKPKEGLNKQTLNNIRPGLHAVLGCSLKLEITDLCTVTAVGEGIKTQAARQAAWLHVVSKMHVDGTLKELFPDKESSITDTTFQHDTEDVDLQPVELNDEVKKQEKDAKIEIYEYAASFGLVPVFEVKVLQPKTPRARLGRTPKRPKPVWQVAIRLQGQNIDVSAVGKDLRTAEIAAALLFKEEAESKHAGPPAVDERRILTVDTVNRFFEFYKIRLGRINMAIENETTSQNGINSNLARVTIDGEQVGQEVTMTKKLEAEAIAHLTAAVELTNKEPSLLRDFEQTMVKSKGKVLRPVKPIDYPVEPDVLDSMRNALLEARKGGLSDTRQTLSAENSTLNQRTRQPTQQLSSHGLSRANELLRTNQSVFEQDPTLEELRSKKAALPMSNYRDQVLAMVSENSYSIVVGATGSGKTTQVPQILFEEAIKAGRGASCNIVCTQPRRIAATSVAQRVAAERNEYPRTTVGHQVRFDSKPPYNPYGITYCTTGVLLERLKHAPDDVLDTVSHICIDEVHERDLSIDFLMIVLKRSIKIRRSEGKPVPKVILMSATLDIELFANYFGKAEDDGTKLPCPALSVPGRTFPVQERYLSTIMAEMRATHGASSVANLLNLHPGTDEYLTAENAFSARHKGESSSTRKDSVIDWKGERQKPLDPAEADAANEREEALVPVSLVATTIAHICATTPDGAILTFLPGIAEILDTQKLLLNHSPLGVDFGDESKFRIFPLHSTSTREQQAEIFNQLPRGCRKIILATNIAETSVTVTDVKYVVDSGKLRENRYDQLRRITKLQCVWVSKSNSKQRAGRAGRVQDGYYFALFSEERNHALKAIGQPELLRSDLQETCLSVKAQNFNETVPSFLAQAIEPPSAQAVGAAVQNLVEIEAFTANEDLTPLGRVLSRLPVHPSLGKMIILGVIFRCLDPMITLGAAVNERSLFSSPIGMRTEASRAHKKYAPNKHSDQLAFLEAFQELRMLRAQYGVAAALHRANENFLHLNAFRTIDSSARQIEDVLVECGLIPKRLRQSFYDETGYGPPELNYNCQNSALISTLLIAGLSPNIAVKTTSTGITYRTPSEHSVTIYPRSRNSESKRGDEKFPTASLFAYGELAKGTDSGSLFLRDTTKVTPLMTLLFGGQLRITQTGRLEMDDWLPFFIKSLDPHFATTMILEFRKGLDRVLFRAFHSLENVTPDNAGQFSDDPVREKFVNAVVQILNMKPQSPKDAFKEWYNALQHRDEAWGTGMGRVDEYRH
jgi:HrpA-like RNA helicase